MKQNQLKRQMMSMKEIILADLKKEIDEEMKKPAKKRDCSRIAELSRQYSDLMCKDDDNAETSRENAKNALVQAVLHEKKRNNIKLYRTISALVACAVVVIGLNMTSIRVFGQNMFSAIYQLSKDGIIINMENQEKVLTENDDLLYMKNKCSEYGFTPQLPLYIPAGLELYDIYENSDSESSIVKFFYKINNVKLNFEYTCYRDDADVIPVGIPTDTYNITEETINGNVVYILKEENQFTATYLKDKIVYCITAHNLDYELYKNMLENMS